LIDSTIASKADGMLENPNHSAVDRLD
jgi:hypothetical protein